MLNRKFLTIFLTLVYSCINTKHNCINDNNFKLVENLVSRGFIISSEVKRVFCEIDRSDFIPDVSKEHSYLDNPVYIGYGATISAPHMHALALETFMKVLKTHNANNITILDVGSGSGIL